MKRVGKLSKAERYLAALLFDLAFAAAFVALCLADKISPGTTLAVLSGLVMARKRPVELDDDDDDQPPPSGARPRAVPRRLVAVSGVLTLLAGFFWAVHWVRQKVGA